HLHRHHQCGEHEGEHPLAEPETEAGEGVGGHQTHQQGSRSCGDGDDDAVEEHPPEGDQLGHRREVLERDVARDPRGRKVKCRSLLRETLADQPDQRCQHEDPEDGQDRGEDPSAQAMTSHRSCTHFRESRNWIAVTIAMITKTTRATAEAYPAWNAWKPCWYRYITIESVDSPGPPSGVMIWIGSKIWNAPMNVITLAKKMVGDIIGMVTCHIRCQAPAPSIRAAS